MKSTSQQQPTDQQSELGGSGAIAQGQGAKAGGERSIVANDVKQSSIFTGDTAMP